MSKKVSKYRVYMDYAALTPIDPRVVQEVSKYSKSTYANPSSLYKEGVLAKKALAQGRSVVAGSIHAHADEIVFISGGTEANILALEGVVRSARSSGIKVPHIVISNIEHSSIMECARMLEKQGCQVSYIPVDSTGIISLDELKKSIQDNTIIVSIMTVNNEIGSIQPIKDISKIIRHFKKEKNKRVYPLLHTDAAQAFLYQELFVEKMGIDLMTIDSSKIYGPRGVGCLYVKRGTPIESLMYGGGQEMGMRSGTENIPGIMGFAKSVELVGVIESKKKEIERLFKLKKLMITGLSDFNKNIVVNGRLGIKSDLPDTAVHILNISIPGIDNEFFVFQLDARGIACSTKSSCLRDSDQSYVLSALGVDSKNAMRFSFGRWTRKSDITKVLKAIHEIMTK